MAQGGDDSAQALRIVELKEEADSLSRFLQRIAAQSGPYQSFREELYKYAEGCRGIVFEGIDPKLTTAQQSRNILNSAINLGLQVLGGGRRPADTYPFIDRTRVILMRLIEELQGKPITDAILKGLQDDSSEDLEQPTDYDKV